MTTSSSDPSAENLPEDNAAAVPRSFALLFALAGLLALMVVRPYWVQLFLGACLSVTLAPIYDYLMKVTRGRRPGMAATVSTLLLLVIVIAPLASLLAYGATEVASGIEWAKQTLEVGTIQELSAGRVPNAMRGTVTRALSSMSIDSTDIDSYAKKALELAQGAVPRIFGTGLSAIGSLILVLLSTFFFLADGGAIIDKTMHLSPLPRRHTRELLKEFRAVGSASLMGLAFSAVTQCIVLTLGFWMAGLPHLFFFAVMALISAFVPLVGSMLLWLPTAILVGVQNGATAGLLLVAWSFISVNAVDTGLKPLVLKGKMALHGGLTFLGMLGGLSVFGPVGFIAGPLVMAFVVAFIRMYERDYLDKQRDAAA